MRPLAEVRAPGRVVLEELLPDAARDGMVQHVGGVVRGEGPARAELRVGEEEHEVLPLVADVVELESEGGAEPVEEVGAEGVPRAGERRRRQVAARIFACLRAHAGYTLPKHADQNDVLRALCAEAGYHVDDDGNVTRLQVPVPPSPPGNKSSAVTAEDLFPLTDVRVPLAWDPLMLRSRFLFSTNGERTSCLHCVLAMCMYSTHPLARRQIFFTPRYKKISAGILLVTNYMVD